MKRAVRSPGSWTPAVLLGLAYALAPVAGAQPAAQAASPPMSHSAMVAAGRQLYTENCSHCHGFNMVNPGTVSFDLRQFPHDDPKRFFRSVLNGKGGMPSWKGTLNRQQISEIWAYVLTGGANTNS